MNGRAILVVTATVVLLACAGAPEPATIVITGARVWTGDPSNPWVDAVATRGDVIIAAGAEADIVPLIGPTTDHIVAQGGLLLPGFIDAHLHFLAGGAGLAAVQLRSAKSREEFSRRIEAYAAELEPGEWILEGAWDHQNWGGELPRREWIDAITAENPVWITRLDGHMGLANSLALEIAGVNAETPEVAGGSIVRGDDGEPTGILKDNAMQLISGVIPGPSQQQLDRFLDAAMRYVASNGVTSVTDVAYDGFDSWTSLATFRRAERAGRLLTRIYSVVPLRQWRQAIDDTSRNGRGNSWLKTGGVKGFMDGSLGSHTAAFFEPFSDTADDRGFLINSPGDMREWITAADAGGLQVMVHAIGDRAIRELLEIYRDVAERNGERDRRFRVEHAQHVHPDDISRFARQQVIASMQPYHAIDDGRWAEKVIGAERAKTTYAFRSLIESGARVAFGSDWFVAPPTPIEGIYAAVTRRTLDGANPGGWVPEQKITVAQALVAYTRMAAYAEFAEDQKGQIRTGMLADMVLLDRDLFAVEPESIPEARVLKTIVGGKVVFAAD